MGWGRVKSGLRVLGVSELGCEEGIRVGLEGLDSLTHDSKSPLLYSPPRSHLQVLGSAPRHPFYARRAFGLNHVFGEALGL